MSRRRSYDHTGLPTDLPHTADDVYDSYGRQIIQADIPMPDEEIISRTTGRIDESPGAPNMQPLDLPIPEDEYDPYYHQHQPEVIYEDPYGPSTASQYQQSQRYRSHNQENNNHYYQDSRYYGQSRHPQQNQSQSQNQNQNQNQYPNQTTLDNYYSTVKQTVPNAFSSTSPSQRKPSYQQQQQNPSQHARRTSYSPSWRHTPLFGSGIKEILPHDPRVMDIANNYHRVIITKSIVKYFTRTKYEFFPSAIVGFKVSFQSISHNIKYNAIYMTCRSDINDDFPRIYRLYPHNRANNPTSQQSRSTSTRVPASISGNVLVANGALTLTRDLNSTEPYSSGRYISGTGENSNKAVFTLQDDKPATTYEEDIILWIRLPEPNFPFDVEISVSGREKHTPRMSICKFDGIREMGEFDFPEFAQQGSHQVTAPRSPQAPPLFNHPDEQRQIGSVQPPPLFSPLSSSTAPRDIRRQSVQYDNQQFPPTPSSSNQSWSSYASQGSDPRNRSSSSSHNYQEDPRNRRYSYQNQPNNHHPGYDYNRKY